MGLFDFIWDYFRGPDLTRDWIERTAVPLEFDLDTCSLGGVPNGSRFEQLNWLGPAESRDKFRDGSLAFTWFSKGLDIEVKGDSFRVLELSFDPPGTGRYQPFPGTLIRKGRRFRIEPACTEAEVVELMGEPTIRTVDENVIETLFYRIGEHEFQFDFSWEGKLSDVFCVEVGAEELE